MNTTWNRREFLGTAAMVAGVQAAPPKKVRIGVIGVGGRGTGFLKASLAMGGVEVAALCDILPEAASRGVDLVQTNLGAKPAVYTNGDRDYKRMLQRDDLEAVFIATPTWWHGEMAVEAARARKWIFSEVPAVNTIEEGWALVRAVEETGVGYFLAENYIFMRNNMMLLNMVEQGVFGTLTFAECGYLHEARDLQFTSDGKLTWRGELNSSPKLIGNTYPTHSLGPACSWLGIPRGDQMVRCTSYMTRAASFGEYARKRFPPDSPAAKVSTWNGDNCLTLIQTANNAVIYLRFDIASPRPHHLTFYTLQGTRASYDDEAGMFIDGKSKGWEPLADYYGQYDHPYWLRHNEAAKSAGHGGGDYFTLQHFYRCIREKTQPGIDVYDAVQWSSLIPLSARSIRENSATQSIPDFTKGKWRDRKRFDWTKA